MATQNQFTIKFLIFLMAPLFLIAYATPAFALHACTNDDAACDTNPDRVDLAQMCLDDTGLSFTVDFETPSTSGSSSGTACAMFDTDQDGNVNYSFCIVTGGSPVRTVLDHEVFSCDDTEQDECVNYTVIPGATSNCTITTSVDTFSCNSGDGGLDARVSCTLVPADFSNQDLTLLNVCSHPESDLGIHPSPSSIKDCIAAFGAAFITVEKVATTFGGGAATEVFSFDINPGSVTAQILGSGHSARIPITPGNFSIFETVPGGWTLASAECRDQTGATVGSLTASTLSGVVASGDDLECTFNNEENAPGTPCLEITKTAVETSYSATADTINYNYEVSNCGTTSISSLTVTDDKIATVTCVATSLVAGASTTCSGSYSVVQADLDNGSVTNEAYASGLDGVTPVNSNPVTETVPAVQSPQLAISKVGTFQDNDSSGFAEVGDSIVYDIEVTNNGNVTLNNVDISDPLLATLDCGLVSLPAVLAPGDSITCQGEYFLIQADVDIAEVNNTATADSDETGPATDSATILLTHLDSLEIDKTASFADQNSDGLAQPGETIDYQLTITNAGGTTLNNVNIQDPLLPSLSCSVALPAILAPGDVVTCTGSYAVSQADIDTGYVHNEALADSDETPEASDSYTQVLPQLADFTIAKSGQFDDQNSDGLSEPGETISYSINLTNSGNVTLTGVTVSDTLLVNLDCTPAQPVASLAPGDSIVCTGQYPVALKDIELGLVLNIAAGDAVETTPKTASALINLPALSGGCTTQNISATQHRLDGLALSLKFMVDRAARHLRRASKGSTREVSFIKSSKAAAASAYLDAWLTDYLEIPQEIRTCDRLISCSAQTIAPAKDKYKSHVLKLQSILNSLQRRVQRYRVKGLTSKVNSLAASASSQITADFAVLDALPNENHATCN